mmetsp:Transcript_75900/g.216481  ORF Transcript_75900/g.216481 Transcript_75900/m.216481 type:complete len:112 (+) Transcript_75900:215-550(+)
MFGGLDILTVDAIHESSTGREYILEVNGTSSGLAPDVAAEDNLHIRDLVVEKMNAHFCHGPGAAVPQVLVEGEGQAAEEQVSGPAPGAAEEGAMPAASAPPPATVSSAESF